MHMLLIRLRSYQILFHVVMYILQALYTAIDTDQLVNEIDMLLSVIKAQYQECHVLDNYLESCVAIYFILDSVLEL